MKFDLYWSPEGRKIATVKAATAAEAVARAPKPYRQYLGEVYAEPVVEPMSVKVLDEVQEVNGQINLDIAGCRVKSAFRARNVNSDPYVYIEFTDGTSMLVVHETCRSCNDLDVLVDTSISKPEKRRLSKPAQVQRALELAMAHIGFCWDLIEEHTKLRRSGSASVHDQINDALSMLGSKE